jgi:hypothetical protein
VICHAHTYLRPMPSAKHNGKQGALIDTPVKAVTIQSGTLVRQEAGEIQPAKVRPR